MKLKKIKEDSIKIMYKIDQDILELDNKTFKIKKNTSNLSAYLNSVSSSLVKYLNGCVMTLDCEHCGNEIMKNRFERNIFYSYKFCETCIKNKNYKLYKKEKCSICHNVVLKKDLIFGTCGNVECVTVYKKNKNKRIKDTHWTKNENFSDINKKRIIKRKENDIKFNRKYVAWNKGKTNIYSKETIEKIRQGVINHMRTGRIKKTGIEVKMDNYLDVSQFNYKYSFILKNRQYDFILFDYNIIIETDGDFWHGNPNFYGVGKKYLYENQKMKRIDDKVKNRIAIENGYYILRFWEYDINNCFENVKDIIENKIKEINEKDNIKNS
jgi:G:T-mismatch repair DNA endonuclease (very short patch repair protein)